MKYTAIIIIPGKQLLYSGIRRLYNMSSTVCVEAMNYLGGVSSCVWGLARFHTDQSETTDGSESGGSSPIFCPTRVGHTPGTRYLEFDRFLLYAMPTLLTSALFI